MKLKNCEIFTMNLLYLTLLSNELKKSPNKSRYPEVFCKKAILKKDSS